MKRITTPLALLAATTATHAAVVSFSTGTITGDTSDIVIGDSITITDFNSIPDENISGAAFVGADLTTVAGTFTSADYEAAADSFNIGVTDLSLSGLTIGSTYEFQVFFSDQRFGGVFETARSHTLSSGTEESDAIFASGGYIIASFVADATTQVFTYTGFNTDNPDGTDFLNPHINLTALAETVAVVPEPSSTLLLGLGVLGFVIRRKR